MIFSGVVNDEILRAVKYVCDPSALNDLQFVYVLPATSKPLRRDIDF